MKQRTACSFTSHLSTPKCCGTATTNGESCFNLTSAVCFPSPLQGSSGACQTLSIERWPQTKSGDHRKMQQLVVGERIAPSEHYTLDSSIDQLLVTGATGFIGGAVLAELVGSPLWRDTLIMVRASTLSEGKERVARSLQR